MVIVALIANVLQAAHNQIWREHIKKENALLRPNEEFRLTRGSSEALSVADAVPHACIYTHSSLHVSREAKFG
jgi:hypothetical protein